VISRRPDIRPGEEKRVRDGDVRVLVVDDGALDGCGALAFVRKQDLSSKRLRELWTRRGTRVGSTVRPDS
jgi:hypothetical protein